MDGDGKRSVPVFLLLVEDEIHGYEGFNFDGFAVEARRLISPLAYCLQCRIREDWVAADHFELADGAGRTDDGAQVNGAGQVDVARERGILRLHFVDERGSHHAFAAVQGRLVLRRFGLFDLD